MEPKGVGGWPGGVSMRGAASHVESPRPLAGGKSLGYATSRGDGGTGASSFRPALGLRSAPRPTASATVQ
jgi:hypothetical protein